MTTVEYDEILEGYAEGISDKVISRRMGLQKGHRLLGKINEWYERYEELVEDDETKGE